MNPQDKTIDTTLYQYISKDRLTEVLEIFYDCSHIHVQVIDADGKPLMSVGSTATFCSDFTTTLSNGEECEQEHLDASRTAAEMRGTHVFRCRAGLEHIIFPIMNEGTMIGSIVAGPFMSSEPQTSFMININNKFNLKTEALLRLFQDSYQMVVLSQDKTELYSKMLYYLMTSRKLDSQEDTVSYQDRLMQRSRMSSTSEPFYHHSNSPDDTYPIDREFLLITKIRTGDLSESKKALEEYLSALIQYEGNDCNRIRIRLIELCTLLAHTSIDRGADVEAIIRANDHLTEMLLRKDNVYDLCYVLQNNLNIYTESMFLSADKNNKVIKRAASYIAEHFADPITLSDVADNIHLNASYLSTLFKQVTGLSFKEYLNHVRIDEAQRLLTTTDDPIMDIAIACGFSDQSYFTKVFKKLTGMTPKQYR